MSRVLVVDDEAGIRKVIQDALRREGLDSESASDGEEALALLARGDFDLVITDLNMPRLDGLDLVLKIRETTDIPTLVLTVRQEERDKVRLLDAGADDYVTKPFGVAEVLARVRALLRRRDSSSSPAISEWGDIAVDREARTVRKAGRGIHLTPTEYALLLKLLERPGGVWTHRQLLSAVWKSSEGVTNDTLRVHMGSLRRKLEDDPNRPRWILTEPWVGYRFNPDA
jgi:two-component system, OmpR family, KDP operon response regulator KdpE